MTISEWLSHHIDSHTIYDIEMLRELPEPVSYDRATDRLVAKDGTSVVLGAMAAATLRAEQGAMETGNPKGAYFEPDVDPTEIVYAGHRLSAALDQLLTNEQAGAGFFGRGSAHRASIKHLAEAGF